MEALQGTRQGGHGVIAGHAAGWLQQGGGTVVGWARGTPRSGPPTLRARCAPHPPRHRVTHILNVAREIDNFFPALFTYMNVRVYDEEAAQLLPHWNDTFLFLSRVRSVGPGQPRDAGGEGGPSGGHRVQGTLGWSQGNMGGGIWGGILVAEVLGALGTLGALGAGELWGPGSLWTLGDLDTTPGAWGPWGHGEPWVTWGVLGH